MYWLCWRITLFPRTRPLIFGLIYTATRTQCLSDAGLLGISGIGRNCGYIGRYSRTSWCPLTHASAFSLEGEGWDEGEFIRLFRDLYLHPSPLQQEREMALLNLMTVTH